MRAKKFGKKLSVKIAKKRFLYSHEYRNQKNAKKNCWEKIVGIKCDKSFFYIHTNIVFKKGTKNARNNFSRNTRIVRKKMLGEKSTEKVQKKNFYIHTNIETKKWGKKTRETIFLETHE